VITDEYRSVVQWSADDPQSVAMSGVHAVVAGDLLTLTCKTTPSNPRAEVTWYDARGRQLTSPVTSSVAATTVCVSRFQSVR